MQRILSTYLFVSKKLTPELLALIRQNRFQAVEIFASRSHFDYATKSEVRTIAQALSDNHLQLNSLHAPTSRDLSIHREGGAPLSITEVERVRRIEAMDELRRVIDVAEDLPYSRLILHMGGSRELADPRKRDAAFSSLEHLGLHAHHAGVTLCIENTTSEMGNPSYLRSFVDDTRLTSLRFNFDIGHAQLAEGPEDERVDKSFEPLRNLIVSAHIHDNHGEKDEHLPPYDGSIDWPAALKLFRSVPGSELPLTIELKEKTGPDAHPLANQLAAATSSVDRLEEDSSAAD
ncbi:MAG: sugar phosphate isomerase/epimerase family protein [Candidatus Acidiferrum sp.]